MRSDLELFVLTLVKQGLATKYDLREQAGISLGSTSPVLERLKDQRLISASEEGSRGSVRFSITKEGTKVLKHEWDSHLRERPSDLDSILRIVYLAWVHGDHENCTDFMARSAEALHGWAASRRTEADRLSLSVGEPPDGATFRWLRTSCEVARAQAEANALLAMCKEVREKNRKTKKKSVQHGRRA